MGRVEHLHIRATKQDKATLSRAAQIANVSLSQFVLGIALPAAKERIASEDLAARTRFELDADRWSAFQAALDAPVRDLPAIRALLQEKPVWEP